MGGDGGQGGGGGDRDGAWRKETVNEAFLGSSEGLSTEEKKESSSLDLTRKTERDLSLIQKKNINQASTTACRR